VGKKGIGKAFLVVIAVGFGLIGLSFLETPFPEIIPLDLLSGNRNIICDGVECRLGIGFNKGNFDGNSIRDNIPLAEVDLNSPILVEFRIEPVAIEHGGTISGTGADPACAQFVSNANEKLNIEAFSVQAGTTVPSLTTSIPEGLIGKDSRDRNIVLLQDIQPLLTKGQDVLNVELVAGTCDIGAGINYFIFNGRCFAPSATSTCTRGSSGAQIFFFQKPPEIQLGQNPLLKQNRYLQLDRVLENATSFAIAERFQLTDPTVITSIVMTLSADPADNLSQFVDTRVTAFIWNMDKSPPERILQSETKSGFGTQETDTKFTFPSAVALKAVENNMQINYAVGIRVEQNLGDELNYLQFDQQANTHGCVISKSLTLESESQFVPNGLCGIDIFHNSAQALAILNIVENEPETLTREELIALLCEGISPQPLSCQGFDTATPTPSSCGDTEIFFNGQCLCAPTYDREANGQCVLEDPSRFDLLQIGQFSLQLLVIIGAIIIVLGIIGIIVRSRR
jgi:hypothetical protein